MKTFQFIKSIAFITAILFAPCKIYGSYSSGALHVNQNSDTKFMMGYAVWFGQNHYSFDTGGQYDAGHNSTVKSEEENRVSNGDRYPKPLWFTQDWWDDYNNNISQSPDISGVTRTIPVSVGYYSNDDNIITHHMNDIRDLGVDIICPDLTNRVDYIFGPSVLTNDIHYTAMQRLYAVLNGMHPSNDLRIVTTLGAQTTADMTKNGVDNKSPTQRQLEFVKNLMLSYPKLNVIYEGKPLIMIYRGTPAKATPLSNFVDSNLLNEFTIREVSGFAESQTGLWHSSNRTTEAEYDPFVRLKDRYWNWVDRIYASGTDGFSSYTLFPAASSGSRIEFNSISAHSDGSASDPFIIYNDGTVANHQATIAKKGNSLFCLFPHYNFFISHDSGFSHHLTRDIEPTHEWGTMIYDDTKHLITQYKSWRAGNGVSRITEGSLRADTGSGENVLIMGASFSGGSSHQRVVVKTIGETLTNFGLTSSQVTSNPYLKMFDSSGNCLGENDTYNGTVIDHTDGSSLVSTQIQKNSNYYINRLNFGHTMDLTEAALTADVTPGGYTWHISDVNNEDNISHARIVAMDEIGDTVMSEITGRSYISGGDNIMILDFKLDKGATVEINGTGPILGNFGVVNPLGDPELVLHDSVGNHIETNSDIVHNINVESRITRYLSAGTYSVHLRKELHSPISTASGVGHISVKIL